VRERKEIAVPHEQVKPVLKALAMGRNRFLFGLDATPDDRLSWSPGGSAYTPLQLAGRVAGFLDFLGEMLRTGVMPDRSGGPPPPPATREEAKDRVAGAFDRMQAMLQGFTEVDLARPVPTPWGEPTPAALLLSVPASVVSYFQGQLNYLQLIYGDTNANMPPNWGKEEI
jgi:hypothetical protein